MERPLLIPFKTVDVDEGAKVMKSDLLLLMLQLAPVLIQMACSLENLISFVFEFIVDCHAIR
jgi:hypothetical protein